MVNNINKKVHLQSVLSQQHRTSGTRTYTRAMGQHSVFSQAGWHGAARSLNPYDTHTVNLNRYSRMREGLNNYFPQNYDNYGFPPPPAEPEMSFMEKLMAGMMLGKVGIELGKGIANLFDAIGIGNGVGKDDGFEKPSENAILKNINSFSDIDNLQEQNLKSLENFNEGYQQASVKTSVSTTLENTDVKAGLALIGNCDLDTAPLELSAVNISVSSPDFKGAVEIIDKDISEINTYVSTNISSAQTQLADVIGDLTGEIAKYKNQLVKLDQSDNDYNFISALLNNAEEKLNYAREAQKALTDVTSKCNESIAKLNVKKAEVQKAQNTHNQLLDKKYDMAKEQDEKLGKVNAEIAKLNAEIAKLGTPEAGSKDQKKLNELRAKIISAYNESTALITSLKSAPTPIKNSGGTEYTIKNLALNSAGGGGQPK